MLSTSCGSVSWLDVFGAVSRRGDMTSNKEMLEVQPDLLAALRLQFRTSPPHEALRWFRDEYVSKYSEAPGFITRIRYIHAALRGIGLYGARDAADWEGFGVRGFSDSQVDAMLAPHLHLAGSE